MLQNMTSRDDPHVHRGPRNSFRQAVSEEDVFPAASRDLVDDPIPKRWSRDFVPRNIDDDAKSFQIAIFENSVLKPIPDKDDDPWALPDLEDDGVKWADLDRQGKIKYALMLIVKSVSLTGLLYLFICSLDFLSSSFRLVGGRLAGEALGQSELMQNPVAGLMIGILATVLVQSSSTSTSITVSMVAAGILPVRLAIPIVMGANVGTAVTGIIVAMAQSGDRNQFRRAFGAASVHNMAAWLSVIILLPIEVATGYLFYLTSIMVDTIDLGGQSEDVEFLKVITKPFTELVIQLDSDVLKEIAHDAVDGTNNAAGKSLIKLWCESYKQAANITKSFRQEWTNVTSCFQVPPHLRCTPEQGKFIVEWNHTGPGEITIGISKCHHLFTDTSLDDAAAGVVLLIISLLLLCVCLILIVKILHSLLKGKLAKILKKIVNSDFPGCFRHFTGYAVIILSAGLTTLLQSSSIFISTLTPLAGVGVVSIERMLPLAFGSKIGTTFTSMLAALASDGDGFKPAFQVALCHLFFNFSGILVLYVIPPMRKLPIKLAMILGNTTATYRWFAVVFAVGTFVLLPLLVFALSLAGWYVLASIGIPTLILLSMVIIINILQSKRPDKLPAKLQNWEFLPLWLHSLEPYDKIFKKVPNLCERPNICKKGLKKSNTDEEMRIEPVMHGKQNGVLRLDQNKIAFENSGFENEFYI